MKSLRIREIDLFSRSEKSADTISGVLTARAVSFARAVTFPFGISWSSGKSCFKAERGHPLSALFSMVMISISREHCSIHGQ